MCYDDFDFDGYDDMDGPGDDFSEDIFDEFESEPDELAMEEETEKQVANEPNDAEAAFDFQDAFILGGMILGQAWEEGLDEKEQRERQDNENKEED